MNIPFTSATPRYAEKGIIVFSHLRWEFVFQRPQHIMSRMSKHHPIFFIEEPLPGDTGESVDVREVQPNIYVFQPRGIHHSEIDLIRRVNTMGRKMGMENPVLWLYSPSFERYISRIDHSLVVYDCMDELTKFKGASAQLSSLEQELFSHADIVFTGGKSLYESKRNAHSHVYCFPSSVEREHFAQALEEKTIIPDDFRSIPGPRVGYYGVIDERIDPVLLGDIADRLPHVSFLMIGPIVKIDQGDLPTRRNIYYLGQKSYQELPQYLKGMDMCMMPFAINDATTFISPTKTLEFMAAGKSIVSTPITDVVRDYSSVIAIAASSKEFAAQIALRLQESSKTRAKRVKKQHRIVARTSWDETVSIMKSIIHAALREKEVVMNDVTTAVGIQTAMVSHVQEGGHYERI